MKVEIGAVDMLPRDRGIRVTLGDDRIAMFRIGDEVFGTPTAPLAVPKPRSNAGPLSPTDSRSALSIPLP